MPESKPADPTEAKLTEVMRYFEFTTRSDFLAEWNALTDEDKHEIRVLLKNLLDADA